MNETDMQHGHDWHYSGQRIDGWLASEKFRGVRVEWDGFQLWTRGGNIVPAPAWFTGSLPNGKALSGEAWCGRFTNESQASCAVRLGGRHFLPSMKFVAFDAPLSDGEWEARMDSIAGNDVLMPVEILRVENEAHLFALFTAIKAAGGEGLVIRKPSVRFAPGRTFEICKVKHADQFKAATLQEAA